MIKKKKIRNQNKTKQNKNKKKVYNMKKKMGGKRKVLLKKKSALCLFVDLRKLTRQWSEIIKEITSINCNDIWKKKKGNEQKFKISSQA